MKIGLNFSENELTGLKTIEQAFPNMIDKIYVVTNKRSVGGGFDSYISTRFYVCFKNGVELSRNDYHILDTLFPISSESDCLMVAYEFNPCDISDKEEVKIWQVSN